MSDRLENYVKKNRDDFDLLEPDAALWEKIDKKLGSKNKGRSLSFLWKVAAILIIFGFSFWAQMQMEQTPRMSHYSGQDTKSNVAEVPGVKEVPVHPKQLDPVLPEFAETEKYYSRKVSSTMKEMNVYLVKYPDVANDMKKDIAELDSVYRTLKHDLGDNVAHEEILSAMIQNYRMKLRILEDIKNELMQNNAIKPTTKGNSHEI